MYTMGAGLGGGLTRARWCPPFEPHYVEGNNDAPSRVRRGKLAFIFLYIANASRYFSVNLRGYLSASSVTAAPC